MSKEGTKKPNSEPCGDECGAVAMERNRYFTGKYMAARDFTDEQAYFLSRRRLHNRLLHGWGVVCGLRISRHKSDKCKDWIVVGSGIALDCCGRELIRECDQAIRLPLRHPDDNEADDDPNRQVFDKPFLICLKYVEEPIELVPALYAEGECDPTRKEPNRVRECAEIVFVLKEDVPPGCWRGDDEIDCGCRDDCEDEPGDADTPRGGCLHPSCPCEDLVPLALIIPDGDGGYEDPDCGGRRTLPVPPDYLTHIVDINWPHGGSVTVSQLRDEMEGQLKITFDRKLKEPGYGDEGHEVGINIHTFVVQYGNIQRSLQFLRAAEPPGVSDDRCSAIYQIDDDFLGSPVYRDRDEDLSRNQIYITLKCDFVLDCLGMPVDGSHLGGRLPSGSGFPGGDFCSWFRVVPDEGYGGKRGSKEGAV